MKNYASQLKGRKIHNIFKISVPCIARYLKIFISLRYKNIPNREWHGFDIQDAGINFNKFNIMKKTVNVALGGCSFIIDEDACIAMENYLDRFKAAIGTDSSSKDVMDELEGRIADLLKSRLYGREVVSLEMAEAVIGQLGYPEGYKAHQKESDTYTNATYTNTEKLARKLFRDPDDKKIAGVCSGLALFLGVDVVLIRIIFLIALICGSAGFWIYLIIWIAAPLAKTAVEKCELRGIPATAENIRRFTETR